MFIFHVVFTLYIAMTLASFLRLPRGVTEVGWT